MSNPQQEQEAIKNFFMAISKLKQLGIIRSDKYLGDIGEYICVQLYNMQLSKSQRQEGYDGLIGDKRCQVKFHNSPKRTNIYVGDPSKYDLLIVVLGPNSKLRPDNKNDFLIYKFTPKYISKNCKRKKGYYCAKKDLKKINDRYS